jgi:hypothetical protein
VIFGVDFSSCGISFLLSVPKVFSRDLLFLRVCWPGPVRLSCWGARVVVALALSPKSRRHSQYAESLATIFRSLIVLQRRRVRFPPECARACFRASARRRATSPRVFLAAGLRPRPSRFGFQRRKGCGSRVPSLPDSAPPPACSCFLSRKRRCCLGFPSMDLSKRSAGSYSLLNR